MDELADAVHDLHLVRLEVPDEVPAERVAVLGVLRLEVLGAVLADDRRRRPRRAPPCRRARRTSSRRRSSRPARPRPARARSARGSRQATAPITPWTPRARPLAPVREEELRVAARAEVDALDRARRRPRGARARRRVQRSSFRPSVRSASKRRRHLGADLVAARPDRRPDHGRLRARRRAQRRPPRRRRPRARASPRGGRRARAARSSPHDRDRQAVGGHREHRQPRLVGPEPVARLAARSGTRAVHRRRVHLAVEREPLRIGSPSAAQAMRRFSSTRSALVARAGGEVERLVRRRR